MHFLPLSPKFKIWRFAHSLYIFLFKNVYIITIEDLDDLNAYRNALYADLLNTNGRINHHQEKLSDDLWEMFLQGSYNCMTL